MSNYHSLLGRPYDEGKTDCYEAVRAYLSMEWEIDLPNFARPMRFWEDKNLDLYGMYKDFRFFQVFDETPRIGDVFLMQLRTPVNSHAAVYVADNKILHHLPGKLSSEESFRPKWSNRVNIHLRHPDVKPKPKEKFHLHEVLDANVFKDPEVKEKIAILLDSGGGSDRGR